MLERKRVIKYVLLFTHEKGQSWIDRLTSVVMFQHGKDLLIRVIVSQVCSRPYPSRLAGHRHRQTHAHMAVKSSSFEVVFLLFPLCLSFFRQPLDYDLTVVAAAIAMAAAAAGTSK